MRNLLALFALVVLAVVGVGWYRNWYQVKAAPEVQGHRSVNIDIDSDKIRDDVNRGVKRGSEKLQDVLEKNREAAQAKQGDKPVPETTPGAAAAPGTWRPVSPAPGRPTQPVTQE